MAQNRIVSMLCHNAHIVKESTNLASADSIFVDAKAVKYASVKEPQRFLFKIIWQPWRRYSHFRKHAAPEVHFSFSPKLNSILCLNLLVDFNFIPRSVIFTDIK